MASVPHRPSSARAGAMLVSVAFATTDSDRLRVVTCPTATTATCASSSSSSAPARAHTTSQSSASAGWTSSRLHRTPRGSTHTDAASRRPRGTAAPPGPASSPSATASAQGTTTTSSPFPTRSPIAIAGPPAPAKDEAVKDEGCIPAMHPAASTNTAASPPFTSPPFQPTNTRRSEAVFGLASAATVTAPGVAGA